MSEMLLICFYTDFTKKISVKSQFINWINFLFLADGAEITPTPPIHHDDHHAPPTHDYPQITPAAASADENQRYWNFFIVKVKKSNIKIIENK